MPTPAHAIAESSWAERLYDERAAEMVLYGRALGLSHAEAEDLLHDAFRALLELESPPRQPHHYLVRAYRNRARNHRRGLLRRLWREFESARWFEKGSCASSAEETAMKALTSLPPDQREVIVLKIWHEMTFEAIGETLGVSPNTAAGRYRYGLRKLRACVAPNSEILHEIHDTPRNDAPWLGAAETLPES